MTPEPAPAAPDRRAAEGEPRYRAVFEQCVEAILLLDAETRRAREGNPAFLALLGYGPDEVQALSLYDVVALERAGVDAVVEQALATGPHVVGRMLWRRKDGALIEVDASAGRIRGAGRDLCFVIARAPADAQRPPSAAPRLAPRGARSGKGGRSAEAGRLSRRETQVLKFLGLGYSNRQIATRLRLSVKTVETFRARLYKKLRLRGRPALVRHALRIGLVTLEDTAADD